MLTIIMDIANKMKDMATSKGFNDVQTINFALRFCQSLPYPYDNVSANADEYWRFPIETLYGETGDCEDTSFLFASIAEAMSYDAVIVMLPGHMAVAIESAQADGTYYSYAGLKYFYCETTGVGFNMGTCHWIMRERAPSSSRSSERRHDVQAYGLCGPDTSIIRSGDVQGIFRACMREGGP